MNDGARPNIRNRQAMAERAWDWSIFDGCFGTNTKFRLSDLDGVGERKEHLLIFEGKPLGWRVDYERGQGRALAALARKPGITVVVFFGPVSLPQEMQRLGPDGKPGPVVRCSLATARETVANWYRTADGNGAIGGPSVHRPGGEDDPEPPP